MSDRGPRLPMSVRTRTMESASVVALELVPTDGAALPEWSPGAHIAVHLPAGMDRQFSLCGDPANRTAYRIAVLLERDGRGGSEFVHNHLLVGDTVDVSQPLNNFELMPSSAFHFIAAGIGITPILPMLKVAQKSAADWNLTYLGKSRTSMAFLDHLDAYGDRVRICPKDEVGRQNLRAVLGPPAPNTAVYACGPERMLSEVEDIMTTWQPGSLHLERFTPKRHPADTEGPSAFDVKLALSNLLLRVPADTSILSIVEEAGVFAPSSCREGTCGTCETLILSGVADHRDSVLSPEEQESNESMMICVSRAKTPLLELEL